MKSFLEHVADDLLSRFGTDLSRVAVVFPNKRASLFLNEHLARLAGQPIWSPAYITISDLFRSHSALKVADPIQLVCELHQCFTQCTGIDETLDHFYGWGQLLLSDFDDLDKNMGPADKVFANVRDIHELDDVSYLTDEQKTILRRFFSNFSDDHNSELKERFLRLWNHIGQIYTTYNDRLASQGLAYEGALYRQVATDESICFEYDVYAFVGFNLLHEVEKMLIHRLQQAGRAIVYQDTDERPPRQLTFASASTENIQARYVSQWLTPERIRDGRQTAIVLCDEGLLQTVIHSLPDVVGKVNVTTGYPLLQTPVASLVTQLFNLRVYHRSKSTGQYHPRYVRTIQHHPYARFFALEDMPDDILPWLRDVVRQIAVAIGEPDALTQESLFRMYTLLNRVCNLVESGVLHVDLITLQRLILQLIQETSIPFHGEPAEGIQVMGVLETRNLDFRHVLLLSCNEGNMPRGVNDTSFIPYSIRKAYGLTTVDHKVAIYQHYFHRLLQRADDVTIIYNNATSDGKTGEMSRFMLQLMVESDVPIRFQTLMAGQRPLLRTAKPIAKTDDIIGILHSRFSPEWGISPTAIATYLRCQLRFFYRYVCNLKEPDDFEEDMADSRAFGNIFHKAAQNVYERFGRQPITAMALTDLLKSGVEIELAVDSAFKTEFFKMTDTSRPLPDFDGLQLINREVIVKYVRLLLEVDSRLAPFTILQLEKPFYMPITVEGNRPLTTKIGGVIDRLDCVTDPQTGDRRIRVIDYKTSAGRLKSLKDTESIFDENNIADHSDYYLQTFLYSCIISRQQQAAGGKPIPVSPSLLFIQHAGTDDYDPTLCLDKVPVRDITSVQDTFMPLLHEKISDIFLQDIAFNPTVDGKRCLNCPYLALCGGL